MTQAKNKKQKKVIIKPYRSQESTKENTVGGSENPSRAGEKEGTGLRGSLSVITETGVRWVGGKSWGN